MFRSHILFQIIVTTPSKFYLNQCKPFWLSIQESRVKVIYCVLVWEPYLGNPSGVLLALFSDYSCGF